MRCGWVLVPVVSVLFVGCSPIPQEEGEQTPILSGSTPPSAEGRVETVLNRSYTGDPEDTPWWTAVYEVTAELGAVSERAPECDVAAAEGGAAELRVEIHNLNEAESDYERNEFSIPVPEMEVEMVGQAEQVVWVDPWGGCDEQISIDLLNPRDPWEYLDVVTLEGYILGVPVKDPSGSGVRLSFEERALEYRQGGPVTLALIY